MYRIIEQEFYGIRYVLPLIGENVSQFLMTCVMNGVRFCHVCSSGRNVMFNVKKDKIDEILQKCDYNMCNLSPEDFEFLKKRLKQIFCKSCRSKLSAASCCNNMFGTCKNQLWINPNGIPSEMCRECHQIKKYSAYRINSKSESV